ncbi:MAG: nucleotidyl transferase AbiEii/AbiGii toxin family protein [Verrucomicrobiota bacterium]|nr:nucleotidyl transferase AbiEii/AbiGii toxin family protein [Verrucomicrobiota bacterium]
MGLLKKIQQLEGLEHLRLVGGTSLALQLGHRKSVHLDLFGRIDIEPSTIVRRLKRIGDITILKASEGINIFLVDGIKVNIVNYDYPWLDDALIKDDLKLVTFKDIASMKLSVITNRGTKKDFIDLVYLLDMFSFDELLSWYKQKYDDGSIFLVLKSLFYFDDAENEEMPNMLSEVNWDEIKNKLITKYKEINLKKNDQ